MGNTFAPSTGELSRQPPAPAPRRSPVTIVVGLLLTVPAFVLLVTDFLLPTVTTVRWSFQDVFPLDPDATVGVGTENYERAVEQGVAGRFLDRIAVRAGRS